MNHFYQQRPHANYLIGHKIQLLLVALILALFSSVNSYAGTETKIWDRSNEASSQQIVHQQWQLILDKYLVRDTSSKVNLFRYGMVTNDDKKRLKNYIGSLQQLDPRDYPKAQQQAYWINLYNALTVQLIIEHYPVKSITKLGDSFFSFGPWNDDAITIAGQTLSLNDIEHKILRPIWQDPRIHYAVNCASFSCPSLSPTAFSATNIEMLLEQGAHDYINHPRGVTVTGQDLLLSSIYKWYSEDFGTDDTALIKHLNQYAAPELKQQLQAVNPDTSDIDFDYNWRLNEIK